MSDETNKVGNTVGEVGEVEAAEEKKSGRQPFDVIAYGEAVPNSVDADGLFLVVPTDVVDGEGKVAVVGYSERKNKPLKKENFASEATFVHYQALVAMQKSEFFAAKAIDLKSRATRIEKFGSEDARKAAHKLDKAKKQMDKLKQQLLDTGMSPEDLEAILADM